MPEWPTPANWEVLVPEVVDCGCCPLDTDAATKTVEFMDDMEYMDDTTDARHTADTVYNAFKWFNQRDSS